MSAIAGVYRSGVSSSSRRRRSHHPLLQSQPQRHSELDGLMETRPFKLLLEIEVQVRESHEAEELKPDELKTDDQLARFQMWAGNIGAFADGHASLDYRLRDNDEARKLMLGFLGSLRDFLRRATEALRPNDDHRALYVPPDPSDGNSSDTFHESISSVESSSFAGTDTESVPDTTNDTPFEQRLQGVERTIDRLYRLSVMIRKPSIASQNSKSERFPITDEEGNNIDEAFTSFAFRFVTHKFSEAPQFLRDRLARGITLRRKRFLYRQRHQKKLSTRTVMALDGGKAKDSASGVLTERDVTVKGVRILVESPEEESQNKLDAPIHKHLPSHTSASAMTKRPIPIEKIMDDEQSRHSTVFTNAYTQDNPIVVPEPPKPLSGSKEFECPYCCLILPISQAKASRWRRHVLKDLEPYSCVFENCSEAKTIFPDRNSWISHMQSAHSSRWICNSPAHRPCSFESGQAYEEHMWAAHKGTFTVSQLPFLKTRSRIPAVAMFSECPLCGYVPPEDEAIKDMRSRGLDGTRRDEVARTTSELITKHLSRHLETISVRALPWQDETEEDAVSEKTLSKAADEGSSGSKEEDMSMIYEPLSRLSFTDDDRHSDDAELTWPDMDKKMAEHIQLDASYDQDWGFIPRPDYYGHDRDPTLQTFLRKLYLDTSPVAGHHNGPRLPAHLVPVHRNNNFFGREFALNAIKEALCPDVAISPVGGKPLTFPRTYAIYAPGGMGKTQVAVQFVTTHSDRFDATFWVHAENPSKIAQDFKNIAVALGLVSEGSVDATDLSFTRDIVKRWLVNPVRNLEDFDSRSAEKASWLLVFDGVEDPDDLNEFWPYDGPGSILITSRNPHSWSTSLQLKPFSTDEAADYLLRFTGREPSEEEKTAVTTIANRLGGLPLALTQMGGIIVNKEMSFTQFLESYEEKESQQELLQWHVGDSATHASNYEHTVASVWAFDNLMNGGPMLNILSMLDPDGIPEHLFTSDTGNTQLPEFAQSLEEYRKARNELLGRSLVTGNKHERKLLIHRLVQDVARARMSQSELRSTFHACVLLVSSVWPFEVFEWRHGIARWTVCEELFPHVMRLKDLYPQIPPSTDTFEDYSFARLLVDAGWYHHERGKSADAVLFNNTAQFICESLKLRLIESPSLTSDDLSVMKNLNYTLAEISHNRGCIATEINEPYEALKYHKQFNQMMIRESKNHPNSEDDIRLAISWNELGNAHLLNQYWKKGEECVRKSIEIMRGFQNFKASSISLPVANLGLAYWLQGKHDKAEELLNEGLKDREIEFGVDDRVSFITGRFLHALGNVKASLGQMDESLNFHRRALLHYKSTLGNRHHRTADVFVKVAEHNIRLDQNTMALALLDHALKAYSTSNNYMPEKARASFKRARALRALHRKEEADAELPKCFKLYTKLFTERSKARGERPAGRKLQASDLGDEDFDDLIAFWSK